MGKLKKLLTLTLVALIGITTIPFTANAANCEVQGEYLNDPACAKNHKVIKKIKRGIYTGYLKKGTYKGKTFVWAKFTGGTQAVAQVITINRHPSGDYKIASRTDQLKRNYTGGFQVNGKKYYNKFWLCLYSGSGQSCTTPVQVKPL